MNPNVLAGFLVFAAALVFVVALAVGVILLGPRKSVTATRREKNRHHLATGVVALGSAAAIGTAFFPPSLNYPAVWIACGITLLVVLPARAVLTEVGIRRRGRRAANSSSR